MSEESMGGHRQSDFCQEHSGQKTSIQVILGMVSVAVALLLFQVGLTLNMNAAIKAELSSLRERVAITEYQIRRYHGYDSSPFEK